ncbi:MAG TPA: S41 family peptidase [Pyrinomonadaceae bacterium]|nr:S41 family peptidase [Pyrinomonadaceae bacterium]
MNTKVSPRYFPGTLLSAFVMACCFLTGAPRPASAQTISSADRDRGRTMLKSIKEDIKKNYYDSAYRGIDLDARFNAADEKMKQATSLGQAFGIIAQAMADLNDSHTFFLPPSRVTKTEYGWQMQMIGDKCFVTAIKPGSDAEAKGLKVGDEIIAYDNWGPTRANMWKLQYLYYTLNPKPGVRLTVQSPDGQERDLVVMAKTKQGKQQLDMTLGDGGNDYFNLLREEENESRLYRHRSVELGDELFIWKMPQFDLADNEVDEIMGKVGKRKALILDLRGNGGGLVTNLQRLVGHFFNSDIKIADLKGRKEFKPMIAKTRGGKFYEGKLVVLIDHRSGSAAELFARIVQLEKRGTVLGDQSAGAVMQSRRYSHKMGIDIVAFYGASITDADLIMTDGKSLENVGVKPDEVILPTGADLAAQRDPVMARAAELVGVKLTPEKAGTLFPIEWSKN